jgi:hypothetical protein
MLSKLIPEAKRPMAWRIFIEGMNLAEECVWIVGASAVRSALLPVVRP